MYLRDHVPLPAKVCSMWGDLYAADGREFYSLYGGRQEVVLAINNYDDMLDVLGQASKLLDGIASVAPMSEQATALIARIKDVIKAATPTEN